LGLAAKRRARIRREEERRKDARRAHWAACGWGGGLEGRGIL
jgi:hypothetical protein